MTSGATSGTEPPRWSLTLYVSGASPHSADAVDAVRRICEEELAGRVDLQVVDVRDEPAQVIQDQVLAVPTLVKRLPAPLRRLVGDLGDVERLRAGLDLGPVVTIRSAPGDEATWS
ncbi:MAG: circadian clock KaiB family protein [Mycobacteriales bacterium]